MSREPVISAEVWARIEPLLPAVKGPMGPPFRPRTGRGLPCGEAAAAPWVTSIRTSAGHGPS